MELNKQGITSFLQSTMKKFSFAVISFVSIIVICVATAMAIDYLHRVGDVKKSGLSSKLLWNNVGQCYYVELDDFNKYYKIVRVEDCDKVK